MWGGGGGGRGANGKGVRKILHMGICYDGVYINMCGYGMLGVAGRWRVQENDDLHIKLLGM